MLTRIFQNLSYAAICPVALIYIFLLNDQWRIAGRGKAILLLWSALFPLCLPRLLPRTEWSIVAYILVPWAAVLPFLWRASRARGARLLFIVLSGILFTYLTNSLADKLALYLAIPAILGRLVLDLVLVFLCARFYRPVFLDVFHAVGRGWLPLCLLPTTLCGAYLALVLYPDYLTRRRLPQVQFFTLCLLLIAVLLYAVTFVFFKRLRTWHENDVDTALLDAQLTDLDRRYQRRHAAAERARILRHDLRHYTPLLSQRLRCGDTRGAKEVLDAMRALMTGEGEDGK